MGSALVTSLASAIPAAADIVNIKFCNDYPQRVYFAIAYPQNDGSWMSRGWARLESRTCGYFDTALHVSVFYYRAVTDFHPAGRRRTVQAVWGSGDGRFHVLPNNNGMFTFDNPTKDETGPGTQKFTKFAFVTTDGDIDGKVSIAADGTASSNMTLRSPPNLQAPPPGQHTIPLIPRAE